MSTPQSAPEISIRDVLQQIDHRLSLIEMDVRENNAKIDALNSELTGKIVALDRENNAKIDALNSEVTGKIDALDREVAGKIEVEIRELRREFNNKFSLVIGLVITSWLSMMATLLFKL